MAFALSTSSSVAGKGLRAAASRAKAARVVRANAIPAYGPDRPLWFPGNPAPAHLTGELAGDYGFDPLGLIDEPERRKWFVQAELQNGRWAMLGVAGILFTSLARRAGADLPDWWNAGEVLAKTSPIPLPSMIAVELLLFAFVETKRLMDLRNPGSQADGSFLGITTPLKGTENGYPGGPFFDPLGMARGDEKIYKDYKTKEIKNARLAMVAFVGFIAQHYATGKSPIDNLFDHLADPTHVTFATNGVSVPHFSEFN